MAIKRLYIPSIQIKGFKCLNDLEVKSFAPINLIAGDNNVGKSSLLEALYVFATGGNMGVMKQIACERMGYPLEVDTNEEEKLRQSLMLSFFKDMKFELDKGIIFYSSNGQCLRLDLAYACTEEVRSEKGSLIKTYYVTEDEKVPNEKVHVKRGIYIRFEDSENFYPLDGYIHQFKNRVRDENVQFIRPSFFAKELNARLWNNISLTGFEKYVIETMQIIDPEIENLAFIEDLNDTRIRIPYVTYKNKSGRYPLSIMGDGVNRMLSLVLGIVNSQNGICLIDEIENGIYYQHQPALWKMIESLSKELNVQVFATTHSLDSVRGFVETVQDAQLTRLEKREKGIKAVCYSQEELRVAMDNRIELR